MAGCRVTERTHFRLCRFEECVGRFIITIAVRSLSLTLVDFYCFRKSATNENRATEPIKGNFKPLLKTELSN
jgi:hypothetical protein